VYDTALSVAKYFDTEKAWLETNKTDLIAAIDTQTNRLCAEIRAAGEALKLKVAEETSKLVLFLDEFKSLELRNRVLSAKSSNLHLLSLTLHAAPTNFSTIMSLSTDISSEKVYKSLEKTGTWGFNGDKIDALTIQASKEVFLAGIVLGRPVNSRPFTEIKLMQVRDGDSTQSPVLYTHPEGLILDACKVVKPVIRFARLIRLQSDRKYTIKAVLAGGGVVSGSPNGSNREQEGLEVKVFDAKFGKDEESNGSSAGSSIFFEFLYIS
jgi:hypothetical protein